MTTKHEIGDTHLNKLLCEPQTVVLRGNSTAAANIKIKRNF